MNITQYKINTLEMYYNDMSQFIRENGSDNVPVFYVFLGLLRKRGYFGLVDAGFTVHDATMALGRNTSDKLELYETQSQISGAMKCKLWNDFALPFGSAKINGVRVYGIPKNKTELKAIRHHSRRQAFGRLQCLARIESKEISSEISQLLLTFEQGEEVSA